MLDNIPLIFKYQFALVKTHKYTLNHTNFVYNPFFE